MVHDNPVSLLDSDCLKLETYYGEVAVTHTAEDDVAAYFLFVFVVMCRGKWSTGVFYIPGDHGKNWLRWDDQP